MALTGDLAQALNTVENTATGEGIALARALEGDASAAKNAQGALIATDVGGNFQYLRVNGSNELLVAATSSTVAKLSGSGNVVGSTTEKEVLAIVLQASTVYQDLAWVVSNFRQTEYRIVVVDDVGVTDVETELMAVLVSADDNTDSGQLQDLSFTSGSTGVQELQVLATNKGQASQMRATVSIQEVQ